MRRYLILTLLAILLTLTACAPEQDTLATDVPTAPTESIADVTPAPLVTGLSASSNISSPASAAPATLTPTWTFELGSADINAQGTAIAIGSDGSIYITGYTDGPLTPEQEHAGGEDIFLAKVTPEGELVWATQFGTTDDEAPDGIAIHGDAIYISSTSGERFHGTEWLARFDTNGEEVWAAQVDISEDT